MSAGAATPALNMETREHLNRLRAGVGLSPDSVGTYTPHSQGGSQPGGCSGEVRHDHSQGGFGRVVELRCVSARDRIQGGWRGLRPVSAHAEVGRRWKP
jgi:hypothetical protein